MLGHIAIARAVVKRKISDVHYVENIAVDASCGHTPLSLVNLGNTYKVRLSRFSVTFAAERCCKGAERSDMSSKSRLRFL